LSYNIAFFILSCVFLFTRRATL